MPVSERTVLAVLSVAMLLATPARSDAQAERVSEEVEVLLVTELPVPDADATIVFEQGRPLFLLLPDRKADGELLMAAVRVAQTLITLKAAGDLSFGTYRVSRSSSPERWAGRLSARANTFIGRLRRDEVRAVLGHGNVRARRLTVSARTASEGAER